MGNNDIDKKKRGIEGAPDLPVGTEGGSEGLLTPEKAGRAREEAKHRGDVVSSQKKKDLEHRSFEEFGQKAGFRTYDAKDPGKNPDKKKPPLDQRHHDGKSVEGE